jgi:hypothetical protein
MDAFARYWDKMNPPDYKKRCDHTRQLFDDYQKKIDMILAIK